MKQNLKKKEIEAIDPKELTTFDNHMYVFEVDHDIIKALQQELTIKEFYTLFSKEVSVRSASNTHLDNVIKDLALSNDKDKDLLVLQFEETKEEKAQKLLRVVDDKDLEISDKERTKIELTAEGKKEKPKKYDVLDKEALKKWMFNNPETARKIWDI